MKQKRATTLPEYDFRGGVRGKHHKAYRQGHSVTVNKEDGTVQVQHFTLQDGAVMLESDAEVLPGFRDCQPGVARIDHPSAEQA